MATKSEEFYEKRFRFESSVKTEDEKQPVLSESSKLKKVLDAFDSGEVILDIGCNNGMFLKHLSTKLKVREAIGLDISSEALEAAGKLGLKVLKCNFNEELIPFPDDYFDAIFAGDIIEHLFDTDHLLSQAHRLLKHNGYLVITTPNLASWHNRISLLMGWQPSFTEVSTRYIVGHPFREKRARDEELQPSGHLRLFTANALLKLLLKYDFKIEKIEGYPFFSAGILGYIDRFFSRYPGLSTFILVKARK